MDITARLVDVEKTYKVGDLEVHAVRGVTMDIEAGSFMALVGPSGSGKTTLLNLIGALDTPTGGNIWVDDQATAGLAPRELADFRNSVSVFSIGSFHPDRPPVSVFEFLARVNRAQLHRKQKASR